MVKKRNRDPEVLPDVLPEASEDSGSDNEMDTVDIEFQFFDPDTEIDFQGIKSLLRQLFDIDANLDAIDLSALADIILQQGDCVGNTVKVDGKETDPYAFLSVINLHHYRDTPAIANLTKYLKARAQTNQLARIAQLLSGPEKDGQVGLVISERFINMPTELSLELYQMLLEQIVWALEDKVERPYNFSYYLILSRTYTEIESKLDAEISGPKSKKPKSSSSTAQEVQYFHPEDEIFEEEAMQFGGFDYERTTDEGAADSKRAFQDRGIKPRGHLIMIEKSKMEEAVKALKAALHPAS